MLAIFVDTITEQFFSTSYIVSLLSGKKIIKPVGCEKINIYNPNRIVLNTYLIFILI